MTMTGTGVLPAAAGTGTRVFRCGGECRRNTFLMTFLIGMTHFSLFHKEMQEISAFFVTSFVDFDFFRYIIIKSQ